MERPNTLLARLLSCCADGDPRGAAQLARDLADSIEQYHAPNQVADCGDDGYHVASLRECMDADMDAEPCRVCGGDADARDAGQICEACGE